MKNFAILFLTLFAINAEANQCIISLETTMHVCKRLTSNFNESSFDSQIKEVLQEKGYSVVKFDSNTMSHDRLTIYLGDNLSMNDCYSSAMSGLVKGVEFTATFQFLPKSNNVPIGHDSVSSSALFGSSARAWNRFIGRILGHLQYNFPDCK